MWEKYFVNHKKHRNMIGEGKRRLDNAKKSGGGQWLFRANVLILVVMGILHSLEAGHYANFIPINGTFQDYNPIRRFLAGQIPYQDFQDYLGLGHLYLGVIFTGILGGKYRASLVAFRLIAFLSTALIFYVLLKIILKRNGLALSITNLILGVLLIQPTFYESIVGDQQVKNALDYAMSTGNSARMLRGAILPISMVLIVRFSPQILKWIRQGAFKIKAINLVCILSGGLAGVCFPWSNDYGICSWLCILLFTFFVLFARTGKFSKAFRGFFLAVIASLASIFVVVEIVTVGNFENWFMATFGTGGYQSWYYIGSKSYYITDVDFSYLMLVQAFIGVFYLVKVWKAHGRCEEVMRYGLPAYANLTCFCAVNEYKLLSGGSSREVALVVLFATLVAEIVNYIEKSLLNEKKDFAMGMTAACICAAWCIATGQEEFNFQILEDKQGVYIEELGGNVTALEEDLLNTKEFLGDKKTFATYASAQELISGNFQPSGTDYIIHVLGDKQREEYLDVFENAEFDYAVTINETYSVWEYWLQRANWFFYESLFRDWHPVYANSYEVYWERNSTEDEAVVYEDHINVRVEPTESRALKVIVETDKSVSGMANVLIDYETNKDHGKMSLLLLNSMVREENSGEKLCEFEGYEGTNIRSSGKEYIPISVIDGYGEVTLTSEPEKSTFLTIHDVRCEQIFGVQYQYLYINAVEESETEYMLCVAESNRNNNILQDISSIYLDEEPVEILRIENGWIYVSKDNAVIDKLDLKNKNMFRVE